MRNIKPDNYTDEEWTNLAGTHEELMQCPGWASDEDKAHWDDAPEDWKEYMSKKVGPVEVGITTETWTKQVPQSD